MNKKIFLFFLSVVLLTIATGCGYRQRESVLRLPQKPVSKGIPSDEKWGEVPSSRHAVSRSNFQAVKFFNGLDYSTKLNIDLTEEEVKKNGDNLIGKTLKLADQITVYYERGRQGRQVFVPGIVFDDQEKVIGTYVMTFYVPSRKETTRETIVYITGFAELVEK